MRLAEADPMIGLLNATVPILWLVAEDGDIRFAWEEVWEEEVSATFGVRFLPAGPHPRRLRDLPARFHRLGHPSLVPDHKGRIGGELICDRDRDRWFLTNRSGRYGMADNEPGLRTRDHLDNAVRLFHEHGIDVVARFGDDP